MHERIRGLEQYKTYVHSQLDQQMYLVIHRGTCTASGPQEHFHQFSLDTITTELKTHAPDLYPLFLDLADVSRVGAGSIAHDCTQRGRDVDDNWVLCT